MTLLEFTQRLQAEPEKPLRFVLPDGRLIPPQFHITEVGHVRKTFIDCGGTPRSSDTCLLQAWVAENDEDHALSAGKLAKIIGLASAILPDRNLPVEVEFEAATISQFPIDRVEADPKALIFRLTTKHTDCLAKESCGLIAAESSIGCC